ncbi:hypothetical protein [Streptomyces sp. NPDC051577]
MVCVSARGGYWPNSSLQWPAYLLAAFGWMLTTAIIAGTTPNPQED